MAYDEELAARVRGAIGDQVGVTEKAMFGGLAFLVDGHMAVAAGSQGGLLLRVDPDETDAVVREDGVDRFEMRGRPMRGWVGVDPSAIGTDEALARWVRVGVTYARSLPPK